MAYVSVFHIIFTNPVDGQKEILMAGPNHFYKNHFYKKFNKANIESIEKLSIEKLWCLYSDFLNQVMVMNKKNIDLVEENERLENEVDNLRDLLYKSGYSIIKNKAENSKEKLMEDIKRIVNDKNK